ncbi:AMP-binding protein [Nocardiopsis sp. JB363]|uniref:AMP-binding protein n=1 Tax=Nocardiopsis sp. JB363 TaxID=1434837 RepID=UPI000B355A40|nr:AMP-binding protein [Nocardiopsis sp. JB363]
MLPTAVEERSTTITAAFDAHAQGQPGRTAVVDGGRHVDYRTIDAASDACARALQDRGVGPGDIVPVLIPRSAELVATLLAVLKTGAAYAALDPEWPRSHVESLVEQLDAPLVITEEKGPLGVPSHPPAGLEDVTVEVGLVPVPITGDMPAAVFFTSGSTGRPKGVVSPHKAIVRLMSDPLFSGIGRDSAMPQGSPLPWDGFALELWTILMGGGTSVLVTEPYLTPELLRRFVEDHGVDRLFVTTALFNMFVEEDLEAFGGLGLVMTGGERLSRKHVRRFVERYPDTWIVNCYGPVESTVYATSHDIVVADCDRPEGIPIGRPIAHTEVHVLDGEVPCGPGRSGEICVGGDGLAVRYLGDPEQTAAKFPSVLIDGRRTRLYRTGDRGHVDLDGRLYFEGRVGRQVKVRGHRIEPAEVEVLADGAPGVSRAIAVPRHDDSGACVEIALFFVPEGKDTDARSVRSWLAREAPRHLVPGLIVAVDVYPLTSTGKIDQKALLAAHTVDGTPVDASTGEADGTVDDRVMDAVSRAFTEVLGTRGVPADLSFFEQGGTSLDAGRVCARLGQRLGMTVPVSRIMAHPTVAGLAGWVRTAQRETEGTDPEATEGGSSSAGGVELRGVQGAFVISHLFDPHDLSSLCVALWRIPSDVDAAALEQAVADVTERHEALRSDYVLHHGRPYAFVRDVARPVRVERVGVEGGEHAVTAVLSAPLNIGEGEVWRCAVASNQQESLLGIAVHHVAFDGWAQSVLAKDLAMAYSARRQGRSPVFGTRAPSLAECAGELAVSHRVRTPQAERQRWVDDVSDLPDLAVPHVEGRPDRLERPRLGFTLSGAEVRALDRVASNAGTTRFVVLLTAYAMALHTTTGQGSFGIGVPFARRDTELVSRAVTCLIETVCVPVRDLDGVDRGGALREMRRVVSRAFAAQDMAYTDLVKVARPDRGERNALFQTLFALQDFPHPDLVLARRQGEFTRVRTPRAMFELVTEAWPVPGGGLDIELDHQPELVPTEFVETLRTTYLDVTTTLVKDAGAH